MIRFAVAGSFVLLAFLQGCSRSQSSSNDGQDAARAALSGAPQDFNAFLDWAETKLQQRPEAAPLPNRPTLAEPKWPLRRLLDDDAAFKQARKRTNWTPTEQRTEPLAEIGPFRSNQPPSATFAVQVQKAATASGGDAIRMTMGGFDILREDVGAIELRLRVPFGEKVTLKWGRAGEQIVLVKSTSEPFGVRVLTDQLAEWSGRLTSIALLTDGVQNEPVVVESLRFLPKVDAFPMPMAVQRVRLGRDLRTALYMHAPGEILYPRVTIPEGAKLSVALGAMARDAETENASVRMQAFVVENGAETTLFDERVAAGAAWSDVSISLDAWAKKTVALGLRCRSESDGLLAFWANPTVYQPQTNAPLVIVYLIDTLAAEHTSLYGYPRPTTPFLQSLAQRGAWFANAFSNSPRTVESIPDLMLSMSTERHGVYHNLTPAPRELVTLAESMRAAGFTTASFVTNVYAGPRAHMDQGFDTFVDKIGYWWTTDRSIADRTVPIEEASAWISAHKDRPMFMYIHTAEPHAPYTPPEGFADRFDPGYTGRFNGAYRPLNFHSARDPRDIQHIAALYDEEIAYADARLGRFWQALQTLGVAQRANIVVTSDHGEEFVQHGYWEHGLNLHNEQTRVPLVFFGPLFGAAGRIDTPAQIMDIMPTLLELFDAPAPYPLGGDSLLPLLRGEQAAALSSRPIFSSNYNFLPRQHFVEYQITRGGWKLVYSKNPWRLGGPPTRFKLFDLKADARERNNLLSQYPDKARELAETLIVWRAAQRPYARSAASEVAVQDAAQIRDLEAMGYVGGMDEPQPAGDDGDNSVP